MKTGIYARYSSEKQAEGYSIELQLGACRKYLEANEGEHEIQEYVDRAKSGATIAGRTSLLRLLADVQRGVIDRVVVYRYDRLGRNLAQTATMIEDLENAGVEIVSATEGDDPFARDMHLVSAQHYIRRLAGLSRDGCIRAAHVGHIGGRTPYGYRRRSDKTFEIDPKTAPIVRRLFRDYVEGGAFKRMARALNAERVPTARGGDWHATTISDMLQNETYIGRLVFNQRKFYKDRKTGRRRYRWNPVDKWAIVECPDLAIVSEDVFNAAKERRRRRSHKGVEYHQRYALSGIVKCAQCGSAYVAQASTNAKGRYVYMACGNRASGGSCDNSFRFRHDFVKAEVMRQLSEILFTPEATAALKKSITELAIKRLETKDAESQDLEARKAACQRKASAIMALMVEAKERGDETDELWNEELAKQQANLKALQKRVEELETGPRLDIAHLTRVVEQAIERQRRGVIEVKEPERIRNALRVLVGRIVAHPDGRLCYKTSPVKLLEADGALRTGLVAGAGFEPATFRL